MTQQRLTDQLITRVTSLQGAVDALLTDIPTLVQENWPEEPATTEPTPELPAPVPNPGTNPTNGGGGNPPRDKLGVSYTDSSGTASQFNLFAAHLVGKPGPHGVLIAMHGDHGSTGEPYWYTSGSSSATVKEYIALAKKYGLMLFVPRTPDRSGPQTWWQEDAYVNWLASLLVYFGEFHNLDLNKVFWVGHSGGADAISEGVLARHADKFTGGGAVMTGGGSPSGISSSTKIATPDVLKNGNRFSAHWIAGSTDNGADGSYDALTWSKKGQEYWAKQGLTTTHTVIPGGTHGSVVADGVTKLKDVVKRAYGF